MAVSQTLTVTEVAGSVNTSDNTSRVRILWQSTQSGDSFNDYTRTAKYYISVNGGAESELSVSYRLPKNTTVTIVDTIITVTHRGDGTGIVAVRTWMDTSISAGIIQKTASRNLTTIPRPTTLNYVSCNSSYFDGTITFGFTAPSAICYNRCLVDLYSGGGKYIAIKTMDFGRGGGSLKTHTYSLSADELSAIYTNMPNTRSGTLRVTMKTYSDAYMQEEVGDGSIQRITLYVPDIEITRPTIAMELTPVTPYEKFAYLYLQGISAVKATFSGSGKYGATIASYAMQIDGKSYPSPYTSDILSKSGSVTITGVANDSRGLYNKVSQTINVIAYEGPYISPSEESTKVICERCTEDGTRSDTGTYLHIKGKRNYTKINTNGIVNTCSVRCRYKPEGGEWSHDKGGGVGVLLWTDTSTDEFDVILPNIVTNTLLSYTVELNIIDDTYIPSAMVFDIPSESIDFELRDGGKGAAFGKHAVHEKMLECEWDARFNGSVSLGDDVITDVVIEEGTKSVTATEGQVEWYYRKWLNGRAECWCKRNVDVNINTAWGTALYYGLTTALPYPFEFVTVPITQTTCEYGNDNMSLFIASGGAGATTYATSVMLCRTDSRTANCNILYHVHGQWK